MSPWDSTLEEQPAGLSTAERPSSETNSRSSRSNSEEIIMNAPLPNKTSPVDNGSAELSSSGTSNGDADAVTIKVPVTQAPPSPDTRNNSKRFSLPSFSSLRSSKTKAPDSSRCHTVNDSEINLNLNLSTRSLSDSAPTVLIHTPVDIPATPIRSIMTSRTLHDSLHRGRKGRTDRLKRGVSFKNVNIREYERVLGDNPSVRAGPPLSIGWRYDREPIIMPVADFEDGKGLPRSSSEFLVPKAVREKLLKEHADVSRREIAAAVRQCTQLKSQRRKTVINLGMAKTEERVEVAKKAVKKILKTRASYEVEEAKLWDKAHNIALEKAKNLEESIRKGESVSSRDLYRVGTPQNNIVPSAKALALAFGEDMASDSDGEASEPTPKVRQDRSKPDPLRHSYNTPNTLNKEKDLDRSSPRRSSFTGPSPFHIPEQRPGASSPAKVKNYRRSDSDIATAKRTPSITACESDSDDILAKLLLDISDA